MKGLRALSIVLCMALNSSIGIPFALSQNLTNDWVEKAAAPLVEKQIADGLSVGYLEGEHYGIVHFGSSNSTGQKADHLTLYEIGSVSKVFTALLLADAAVRGELDLQAAAEVANQAGIQLPSHDGRSITWLDLRTHRAGLPRLPDNLKPADTTDPYRDYDSKMAAAFLTRQATRRSTRTSLPRCSGT